MSKKIEEEMTEQLTQIWKQYNDPLEIRRRSNEKRREQILKEKKSDFCLEENEHF